MPINTVYNPSKISEFTKDNLQFSGQSLYFECAASTEAPADLTLSEDFLLTGGSLMVEGGFISDKISLQIVHPVLGVVNEFISGYRVISDTVLQIKLDLIYPAKLSAGLSVRCKYESSSEAGTRKIAVNFFLHRVLF